MDPFSPNLTFGTRHAYSSYLWWHAWCIDDCSGKKALAQCLVVVIALFTVLFTVFLCIVHGRRSDPGRVSELFEKYATAGEEAVFGRIRELEG